MAPAAKDTPHAPGRATVVALAGPPTPPAAVEMFPATAAWLAADPAADWLPFATVAGTSVIAPATPRAANQETKPKRNRMTPPTDGWGCKPALTTLAPAVPRDPTQGKHARPDRTYPPTSPPPAGNSSGNTGAADTVDDHEVLTTFAGALLTAPRPNGWPDGAATTAKCGPIHFTCPRTDGLRVTDAGERIPP